jgi:hypothetical protein
VPFIAGLTWGCDLKKYGDISRISTCQVQIGLIMPLNRAVGELE